jgi:sugar phosphate isomerase/epimerase
MIFPAVSTAEFSPDFERALDVMLEYGVTTAELRGLWGKNVLELDEGERRRAKEALDGRGMSVCSIASPFGKCKLHEDGQAGAGPLHLAVERGREEQMTVLERAIELCRFFGTELVRGFAFWKQGELTEAVWRDIEAAFRAPVALAEREGIILGLENEHACMLGTGAEAGRLIGAIDSPAFRAIWDPGNAFFAGETPFPEGYRAVAGRTVHIHVKDAVRRPDGEAAWAIVGEGEIDYPGQFRALVADGYQGGVSLETHYRPPSGNTEEGSRLCLQGMLRLLRDAGALGDAMR